MTGMVKETIFFFLVCEEEYELEELISKLKEQAMKKGSSLETYHRDEIDLYAVLDSALNLPMFSEGKLIVLRYHGEFLRSDSPALIEYFQRASSRTTFVVAANSLNVKGSKDEGTGDGVRDLLKLFKKGRSSDFLDGCSRGVFVEGEKRKKGRGEEILKWLKEEIFRISGLKIKSDAAQMLAEICGMDRMTIARECEKISSFKTKGGEITIEDIRRIAADNRFFDVYALINHICSGNRMKATETLRSLLNMDQPQPLLFWHLDNFFSKAALVKRMISEGADETKAAQAAGFRFYIQETLKNIRSIDEKKILRIPRLLFEAERLIRSGLPEETILEKLIWDLS
ncbi:MAG: DNA polymerase III subunit delta [Acidobacteriota bacterium]